MHCIHPSHLESSSKPDHEVPAQILAHHADFPTAEELAAEGPVLLEPFQTMLQFAFEGLLGPLPACKQPAGATFTAICLHASLLACLLWGRARD